MAVLLLFTVRDTERSRALDQALGELLRHPGAERVPVSALEPADVAALVERLTGEPPHARVVAALMDRTAGNPFYTTELVRLISSEHARQPLSASDVRAHDVPSGIRDVLLRRAGRLPGDTQSLLMVAAVAGPGAAARPGRGRAGGYLLRQHRRCRPARLSLPVRRPVRRPGEGRYVCA
jgi:hypothetical protein